MVAEVHNRSIKRLVTTYKVCICESLNVLIIILLYIIPNVRRSRTLRIQYYVHYGFNIQPTNTITSNMLLYKLFSKLKPATNVSLIHTSNYSNTSYNYD